jgi:hypothetical protein
MMKTIIDQLRQAIAKSDETEYAIAKDDKRGRPLCRVCQPIAKLSNIRCHFRPAVRPRRHVIRIFSFRPQPTFGAWSSVASVVNTRRTTTPLDTGT